MSTRHLDRVLAKYAYPQPGNGIFGNLFKRWFRPSLDLPSDLVQLNTGKFIERSAADDIKANLDKLMYGSEDSRCQIEYLEQQIDLLRIELQLLREEGKQSASRTPGKIRIELKEKELRLEQLQYGGVEALNLLYRVCRFGERPDINGRDLFTSHLLYQHQLMDLNGQVYPEVKKVVLAAVLPSARVRQSNGPMITVVTPYEEDSQPLPFAVYESMN